MQIIDQPFILQNKCLGLKKQDLRIGFVPTMGALHDGHLSLIRRARKESDIVVASIFVNPTQFNNPEDFKNYPKTVAADIDLLKTELVDVVFAPDSSSMYSDAKKFSVIETTHSTELCGLARPGHFNGVLTIMIKLIQLVQPTKVFMGEKDYQQLQLIQQMVAAFFIPTEIVCCPTVRDDQHLALSSRNSRLTTTGLLQARCFAQILKKNQPLDFIYEELLSQNIKIDYLEEKYGRRFAAVFIDGVRLIDNVRI